MAYLGISPRRRVRMVKPAGEHFLQDVPPEWRWLHDNCLFWEPLFDEPDLNQTRHGPLRARIPTPLVKTSDTGFHFQQSEMGLCASNDDGSSGISHYRTAAFDATAQEWLGGSAGTDDYTYVVIVRSKTTSSSVRGYAIGQRDASTFHSASIRQNTSGGSYSAGSWAVYVQQTSNRFIDFDDVSYLNTWAMIISSREAIGSGAAIARAYLATQDGTILRKKHDAFNYAAIGNTNTNFMLGGDNFSSSGMGGDIAFGAVLGRALNDDEAIQWASNWWGWTDSRQPVYFIPAAAPAGGFNPALLRQRPNTLLRM